MSIYSSEQYKKYYDKNRDKKIAQSVEYQKHNRPRRAINEKARYGRIKFEVINHYGGKCACCGIENMAFLQIDHIHNDGAQHRRMIKEQNHGRVPMVIWLRQHGFPEGFQVLCANCNMAKEIQGVCPHKLSEVAEMTTRHDFYYAE